MNEIAILSPNILFRNKYSPMMQTSMNSGEFVDITYTVDDVVNKAGYGKFQIRLLILAGLGWAVFAGFAIGSVVLGIVADKFGRKKALGVSAIILFIVGIGNAFVPSFLWMVVCRAIIGIALGGVNQGDLPVFWKLFNLICEELRVQKAIDLIYDIYFWSLGSCIVILLSWVVMEYLNSWRFLIGFISLPCLLVIISYKWYPESARYYLVSGQYDRAVDTLQKLSNMNGVDLPSGRLLQVKTQEKRGDLKYLLCKEYRITSLLLWYIWFASAFSAYGVFFVSPVIIQNGFLGTTDNSTLENSFEDPSHVIPCLKFTNQNFIDLLWTSAAEFPGLLVFTFLAEKCRRKVLVSGSCIISGILLLLLLLRTQKIVILLILFASRGIMISVLQLVYIVTLEYFWSLGSCIVILLSWVVMEYLNSWRFLIGFISLPCLLVIISYKWYPESARYYLVSGQYERAVDTLQKLSNMNGVDLPSGRLLHVKTQEKRGDLKYLLCKEYRITSLLLWYIWFASAFSAYGVFFVSPVIIQNGFLGTTDNSTLENSFEDSSHVIPCLKFTNQNFIDLLWTSAAEFPGLLVFTFLAEKCRRKVLVSGSCIISGILLLLLLLRTQKIVILLILFASRGIMISVLQLVYIVTLEAYPTTFRSIGIGCGNFFSKIGGITIPYVAQVLVIENPTAAMGLISGIIFLAGIAAVFLPFETKGARMKEGFHQNEE
ncbi:synaptic vesicle 2-related protein [Trichonephila inaurata madagascariensis]|uniref:Synaptic vesicle 2-related protein n=1 Tax=Trichonephila inaurata madagascariensis TaxID=2747483 RepID=A0A8X6XEH9_9ARAC|nr:synaptic vesicle 2-related protein [Trichonephila inaurata madagascariensis]